MFKGIPKRSILALLLGIACATSHALDYSGRQRNAATFETLSQARANGPNAVSTLEGNAGATFVSHPVLNGYPEGTTWIYRSANLYGGRAAARLNTNILVFVEKAFTDQNAARQYLADLGLIRIIDEAIGSVILVTPADGRAFGAGDFRRSPIHRDLDHVPPVDVERVGAGIGREDHPAPVGAHPDVLGHEPPGREEQGVPAGFGKRVQVRPAILV
jgi:hypothetical protein